MPIQSPQTRFFLAIVCTFLITFFNDNFILCNKFIVLKKTLAFSEKITALALSPDGSLCAVGFSSGRIRIIQSSTGRIRAEFLGWHRGSISHLLFLPENDLVSLDEQGNLIYSFYEINNKKIRYRTIMLDELNHEPTVLIADKVRKRLFVGTSTGFIYSYHYTQNMAFTTRRFIGHSAAITALKASVCGTRLFSGSADTTIKIWDLEQDLLIRTLSGHQDRITSLVLSGHEKTVISASRDHTVIFWDILSGALCSRLPVHARWVNDLVCLEEKNAPESIIFSCDDNGMIAISRLNHDQKIISSYYSIVEHYGWINGLVIFSEEKKVISYGENGYLYLWDKAGKLRQMIHGRRLFDRDARNFMIEYCVLSDNGAVIALTDDLDCLTLGVLGDDEALADY